MAPIPALDGLRAVAVLLVLAHHVWLLVFSSFYPTRDPSSSPLYYGKTGVQLFFVLSGFLLFLPYAEWLFNVRPRPSALLFYRRRALRVGPAYWISLVILTVAAPLSAAALSDAAIHAAFLSNTSSQTLYSINSVYWTMAVEVQFYLVLPLIGWGMKALTRKVQPGTAVGAGLLLLLLLSLASHVLGSMNRIAALPLVYPFLVGYGALSYWVAVFGCGMGCSFAYVYLTRVVKLTRRETGQLRAICTGFFFAGIAFALVLACVPVLQHLSASNLLYGLAYAGVLLGVLLGAGILRVPFASRPMRFLGLISYSFYLWHNVVLGYLAPRLPPFPFVQQWVLLFTVGLGVSTLVAYVSYQGTERPFIRARKRAHERTRAAVEPGNPSRRAEPQTG